MGVDYERMTRQFLMGEVRDPNDIFTFIQGLNDALANFTPKTMSEKRRLDIAKNQLREIKRSARRMQNEITLLEEKVTILEESRKD
jgi:hypothetical protein